jgi:hypothetical protein
VQRDRPASPAGSKLGGRGCLSSWPYFDDGQLEVTPEPEPEPAAPRQKRRFGFARGIGLLLIGILAVSLA